MSLQELKFLLEKLEKDVYDRDRRIALLEKIIVNLGGYLPGKNEKEFKEILDKVNELKKKPSPKK